MCCFSGLCYDVPHTSLSRGSEIVKKDMCETRSQVDSRVSFSAHMSCYPSKLIPCVFTVWCGVCSNCNRDQLNKHLWKSKHCCNFYWALQLWCQPIKSIHGHPVIRVLLGGLPRQLWNKETNCTWLRPQKPAHHMPIPCLGSCWFSEQWCFQLLQEVDMQCSLAACLVCSVDKKCFFKWHSVDKIVFSWSMKLTLKWMLKTETLFSLDLKATLCHSLIWILLSKSICRQMSNQHSHCPIGFWLFAQKQGSCY